MAKMESDPELPKTLPPKRPASPTFDELAISKKPRRADNAPSSTLHPAADAPAASQPISGNLDTAPPSAAESTVSGPGITIAHTASSAQGVREAPAPSIIPRATNGPAAMDSSVDSIGKEKKTLRDSSNAGAPVNDHERNVSSDCTQLSVTATAGPCPSTYPALLLPVRSPSSQLEPDGLVTQEPEGKWTSTAENPTGDCAERSGVEKKLCPEKNERSDHGHRLMHPPLVLGRAPQQD